MGLFSGRAGLVSGAAGGIGRATAVALGREGASVLVTDIEAMRAEGEETVALVEKEGGRASFLATDVARADDVRRMVDTTVELFGSLDFAHNNAGVLATGFTADVDEADFDRIMEIDVKGVWLSMKYELLRMMRHGGGVIVNTASEAGLVGTPMAGPYVAAKHAVIGLTKTAAGEYANMGIRINAVAPGAISSRMVLDLPEAGQQMLMAPQPMHRFGTPEEVADSVVFLCSDRASFITGTVLSIDGGATSNAQSYDPALSPTAPMAG